MQGGGGAGAGAGGAAGDGHNPFEAFLGQPFQGHAPPMPDLTALNASLEGARPALPACLGAPRPPPAPPNPDTTRERCLARWTAALLCVALRGRSAAPACLTEDHGAYPCAEVCMTSSKCIRAQVASGKTCQPAVDPPMRVWQSACAARLYVSAAWTRDTGRGQRSPSPSCTRCHGAKKAPCERAQRGAPRAAARAAARSCPLLSRRSCPTTRAAARCAPRPACAPPDHLVPCPRCCPASLAAAQCKAAAALVRRTREGLS